MDKMMFIFHKIIGGRQRYKPAAKFIMAILILAVFVSIGSQKTLNTNSIVSAEMSEILITETEVKEVGEDRLEDTVNTDGPLLIVVDAGHGGEDSGCIHGGIMEKDINLDIALRLEEALKAKNYGVVMTRSGDIELTPHERVILANKVGGALFISIHQNAGENMEAYGIETWIDGDDGSRDNLKPGLYIQNALIEATGGKDRGIYLDGGLAVTDKTNIPACLVETGFLSNPEERELLKSEEYRQIIADGIAMGIDTYLSKQGEEITETILENKEKTMYLTFDDGPSEKTTPIILDILKAHGIKATFFLIGENVRKYPEIARRIAMEGHAIGVHCDNHTYKSLYASAESYLEDFNKAKDTVKNITGVESGLFRFPGGSVNNFNKRTYKEIIKIMSEKGYVYYDWNAELGDAIKDCSTDELMKTAEETAKNRNKVVMLAHDTIPATAEILEDLIKMFSDYKMEVLTMDLEPVQFKIINK